MLSLTAAQTTVNVGHYRLGLGRAVAAQSSAAAGATTARPTRRRRPDRQPGRVHRHLRARPRRRVQHAADPGRDAAGPGQPARAQRRASARTTSGPPRSPTAPTGARCCSSTRRRTVGRPRLRGRLDLRRADGQGPERGRLLPAAARVGPARRLQAAAVRARRRDGRRCSPAPTPSAACGRRRPGTTRRARRRQRPRVQADRRRERRAQPARAQLPAHVPDLRHGRLGRAHARRRRRGRQPVEVPARSGGSR